MTQALALGQQRLLLSVVGLRAVDLLELPVQEVELAVARAAANASRRSACSGPQKPSRISSCADASVSRRCSCWP